MSTAPKLSLSTGPFSTGQYVWAKFAHENTLPEHDLPTLADYRAACVKCCGFDWLRCRVDSILALNVSEYDLLADSLLLQRPWFAGQGGTGSDAPPEPGLAGLDALQKARRHEFRKVVLVQAPGRESVVIDPENRGYAYSAGLNIRTAEPEIHMPGNCLGRWVFQCLSKLCAVVCDSRVHRDTGNPGLKVLVMGDDGAPRHEISIPIPDRGYWEWAFRNPDHEKMPPGDVAALREAVREREKSVLERFRAEQAALEEQQTSDPDADPLGCWIRHPAQGCAVIDASGEAFRSQGRVKAILMNDAKRPVEAILIQPGAIDAREKGWRWVRNDPDFQKLTGEEMRALRACLQEKQSTDQQRLKERRQCRSAEKKRLRADYLRHKPKWAQSAIVAELREPLEPAGADPGSAAGSIAVRRVLIFWSRFARERFRELRYAAERFTPTARLAAHPAARPEVERELPAPDPALGGYRFYLAAEDFHGNGWKVRKVLCSYLREHFVEWDAPELSRSGPAAPEPASS